MQQCHLMEMWETQITQVRVVPLTKNICTLLAIPTAIPASEEFWSFNRLYLFIAGWHEDNDRKLSQHSLGELTKHGSKTALNRRVRNSFTSRFSFICCIHAEVLIYSLYDFSSKLNTGLAESHKPSSATLRKERNNPVRDTILWLKSQFSMSSFQQK